MEKICGANFDKAKPYLLTVGLQFGMAGTYIFTMASLNHGMSRLVFIVYRNAIAAFALAPFALIFERKIRPKMTISVFLQILALGFLEPVIDQGFTFLGMQYTSASFASSVMNAVPSVTFLLAVILRKQHVVELPYEKEFSEKQIPTKARPIQMNQELLQFCQIEIKDLLNKGLIRKSKSHWSCSAFYVNKQAEIERGTPRLVINYKPLNQALCWIRLERVNIKELRSQAKVVGTIASFAGALLMTLYKGPQIHLFHHSNTSHQQDGSHSPESHKNWVIGTLYIGLGCLAWSSFYILQSITVRRYPAELSLSSLICLMGTMQSAVVASVADHHPRAWAIGFDYRLYGPLYTGVMSSGIAYYIQGMVMQSRGPVFVTSFNPLCMIIVVSLGSFLLGEHLYLGSIIGSIIIAVGLYSVVWGKGKDYAATPAISSTTKETETQQLPITSSLDK